MTPRPPSVPSFDPDADYPARDANDLRELATFFAEAANTFERAAAIAAGSEAVETRLDEVAALSTKGRAQAEQLQHLLAEFAIHQGYTQRGIAKKLDISNSTVYLWWHDPLSRDDLV